MSHRAKRNLGFAVVAAVVFAGAAFYVTRTTTSGDATSPEGVTGLAPLGGNLFAAGDHIAGAYRGVLSPDGSNLAVLTPDGLGLVENGNDIRPVTDEGSRVVDAAWFGDGATLLVAEGPAPTGLVAVVQADGKVRGSIRLQPSVGFGTGHGMAVAPGGRQAVVTAVDRPPLGTEQRRLVHIDLETGTTRDLTPPGGPDEERPFFLDAKRVAFVETTVGEGGGVRTLVVDVADGSVLDVAAGVRVVGATDDGKPVLERSGELLLDGRRLAEVPTGTAVSSVRPESGLAVLAETTTASDGTTVTRLRRLRLADDD